MTCSYCGTHPGQGSTCRNCGAVRRADIYGSARPPGECAHRNVVDVRRLGDRWPRGICQFCDEWLTDRGDGWEPGFYGESATEVLVTA